MALGYLFFSFSFLPEIASSDLQPRSYSRQRYQPFTFPILTPNLNSKHYYFVPSRTRREVTTFSEIGLLESEMIPSWSSARGFSSCAGFPQSFSVRRGKYCQAACRRQSNVVTSLKAAKKELQGAEKIKLS